MGEISEWLKVMLEEIERKEAESAEDQAPAPDDGEKGVPVRPGEGGEKDKGGKDSDG